MDAYLNELQRVTALLEQILAVLTEINSTPDLVFATAEVPMGADLDIGSIIEAVKSGQTPPDVITIENLFGVDPADPPESPPEIIPHRETVSSASPYDTAYQFLAIDEDAQPGDGMLIRHSWNSRRSDADYTAEHAEIGIMLEITERGHSLHVHLPPERARELASVLTHLATEVEGRVNG